MQLFIGRRRLPKRGFRSLPGNVDTVWFGPQGVSGNGVSPGTAANVLRSYTIEQLTGLGVSWVWMGLEGENSQYAKLHNIDTMSVVRELQSHGIHVLGSTIIGVEDHTPENIDAVIEHAVKHDTDFHQFMLYTPVVGTPLHEEMIDQGRVMEEGEFNPADIHGQSLFSYRHPHIKDGLESELIVRAFRRDFEVNGPSLARIVRTTLTGWKRYKNHPDPRIRRRFAWSVNGVATTFAATIWATRRYYYETPAMYAKMSEILQELYREFGLKARLAATLGGRYVLRKLGKKRNGSPKVGPMSRQPFTNRTSTTETFLTTIIHAPPSADTSRRANVTNNSERCHSQ